MMLLRTVISKISWEKKASQDGKCCECFKSSAALIYEFTRLFFSELISLEGNNRDVPKAFNGKNDK